MSAEAATALVMIALAVLLGQSSVIALARGQSRALGWGDDIRREKDRSGFWIAWSLWAGMAVFVGVMGVREALKAYALRDSAPALVGDDWAWLALFLGQCMLLAWFWGRGGSPLEQFRLGRARWRQAERIRALTDDRDTGMKDLGFDEFVDLADMEWLEEVELRLELQAPPRNLALAIDAKAEDEDAAPASTTESGADS